MQERILLTGAGGQLASAIRVEFSASADILALRHGELDITQLTSVNAVVDSFKPTLIINCAAYNQVDRAESDAGTALAVNAFGVRTLVRASRGATLLHYSTDFVFDGEASRPYTEVDRPNPGNVYGASKLLGEWFAVEAPRAFVLRVASLFGGSPAKSSVDRIIDTLIEGGEAKVFVDRTASPSYVADVAAATRVLLRTAEPGLYHCTGSGQCSWHELAEAAAAMLGSSVRGRLQAINGKDLPLVAARPRYAAMSNDKLTRFFPMPTWRDALERYIKSRLSQNAQHRDTGTQRT